MRIARFSTGSDVRFGVVEGDERQPGTLTVATLAGHPFGEAVLTGERHALSEVRLLAPVLPSKILGIGKNYADHAREMGGEVPGTPVVFLKPSTSVIGPGDAIAYPDISAEVHHEAELAVVIGRLCRDVPAARVPEVILGYTCANDVTARDLQRAEPQWARAKGLDTFCPRQSGRTKDMVRDVTELVVHVSRSMTLLPGDVILTGTPAGVGPLQVGDDVAVTVEGIGTLTNRVIKRG